ncbi:MAG TPA: hypothetical protein VKG84_07270 [Candidatus Acidoferrales bacterium]|nr:hypothetical protein [Candidatus Acidoferrales bacterium]
MKSEKQSGFAVAAALALALTLAGAAAVLTAAPSPGRASAPAAPRAQQKTKDKKPAAAPGVFVEDRGTFQVQVDGHPAGTEEFDIRPSAGEWTARGTAEVPGENGTTSKVTGKLELTPDGAPLRYEWTATAPRKASATIVFEGTTAKMEVRLEGANPYAQEFNFQSPPVVILDNNMYHQYAILARIYDWEHKEPKTYAVLIPQDLTPGSVTVEYGGPQVADGQKFETLRVKAADLEIDLYCDNGRLMRLEVPASKAVIVRQAAKK